MVEWLVSEPMIIYYIHNFRDSMWPAGQLAKPVAPRTAEVSGCSAVNLCFYIHLIINHSPLNLT